MSSTNKTSLGLNMWEASDKPVRQDFVNDNVIVDEKISELNGNLELKANASDLANVNSNLNAFGNKLILSADCKYLAHKQYSLPNTGGNNWVNINLSDLGITGKKLPDYCAPIACVSWVTGDSFWVTYCHRYDATTLQVRFNTVTAAAFRITLIFGLIDA